MQQRLLRMALDSEAEVALYVRDVPDVYFRGRIQDLDSEYVALFHPSEDEEGMLWAFRLTDVVGCGLVTRLNAESISALPARPHAASDC